MESARQPVAEPQQPKEKGKAVNARKQRNTKATGFWLLRLYGLVGLLLVTLVLIGIVVFLSKILPNGNEISYSPIAENRAQVHPFTLAPAPNIEGASFVDANCIYGYMNEGCTVSDTRATAPVFAGCQYACAQNCVATALARAACGPADLACQCGPQMLDFGRDFMFGCMANDCDLNGANYNAAFWGRDACSSFSAGLLTGKAGYTPVLNSQTGFAVGSTYSVLNAACGFFTLAEPFNPSANTPTPTPTVFRTVVSTPVSTGFSSSSSLPPEPSSSSTQPVSTPPVSSTTLEPSTSSPPPPTSTSEPPPVQVSSSTSSSVPPPPSVLSTIVLPESTLVLPVSTEILPQSTEILAESTVIVPPSTVILPESTVILPETIVIVTGSTPPVLPTLVIPLNISIPQPSNPVIPTSSLPEPPITFDPFLPVVTTVTGLVSFSDAGLATSTIEAATQNTTANSVPTAVLVPVLTTRVSTVGTNSAGSQVLTTIIATVSSSTSTLTPATPIVVVSSVGTNSVGSPIFSTFTLPPSTVPNVVVATSGTLPVSAPAPSSPLASGTAPGTTPQIQSQTPQQQTSASATPSLISGTPTASGGGGGGGGAATGTPEPTSTGSPDVTLLAISWPVSRAVLGNFTPLILARVFILGFSGAVSQVSAFEPMRLMSQAGASGAVLTGATSAALLPASAVGLLAQVASAFTASSLYLDTHYCVNPATAALFEASVNPCWPPRLSYNGWVVYCLIATLCLAALCLMHILYFWFQTPKTVTADPTSIAGVAAVMGHPAVEAEFSALPPEMTTAQLLKHLQNRKFVLGDFERPGLPGKYGLMPAPVKEGTATAKEKLEKRVFETKTAMGLTDWKAWRIYVDVAFAVFFLALIGLAAAALKNVDDPRKVFLAYLPGSSIGMRILFALLGVIIAIYWGLTFRDTQTFAPYVALASAPSKPKPTILLRRHILPITALIPLLRNGYYVPASAAFTALFSEILIVALAGLPYRPGQLRGEYLFCAFATIVILVLMLAEMSLVIWWRSKAVPHLPRRPDTVAAVMTYVAGARMNGDFDGLEQVKEKERERAIVEKGKVYGYAEVTDAHGMRRWMVDQVDDGRVLGKGSPDGSIAGGAGGGGVLVAHPQAPAEGGIARA